MSTCLFYALILFSSFCFFLDVVPRGDGNPEPVAPVLAPAPAHAPAPAPAPVPALMPGGPLVAHIAASVPIAPGAVLGVPVAHAPLVPPIAIAAPIHVPPPNPIPNPDLQAHVFIGPELEPPNGDDPTARLRIIVPSANIHLLRVISTKLGDGSTAHFGVAMSTLHLLGNAERQSSLYIRTYKKPGSILLADDSRKIIVNKFPILVCGTVDMDRKFRLIALAISSHVDKTAYEWFFRSVSEAIHRVYGYELSPNFVMSDAAEPIVNAAKSVWPLHRQ